jgi:hypothetical protein
MIMKKARDLALRRSCLREISEGSRVIEELPLDFGRESTPSHDDGRSQKFHNFLVLVERLTNLPRRASAQRLTLKGESMREMAAKRTGLDVKQDA